MLGPSFCDALCAQNKCFISNTDRPANSPDLVGTVPIFSPCPDCPDHKPKCPDIGAISENQNGNLAFVK